jgi:hypothetical protein
MADPLPPFLWGDWRPTSNPDMYVAECAACGGSLWVWRPTRYDDEEPMPWRATCANVCTLDAIQAGADVLLHEQRVRQAFEDEAKATMEPDDPLYGLDAETYVAALTGKEPTRGFFQCPFHGDGAERTPSLNTTGPVWYCHACHRGGTVYDFGAELWGIEPRRDGFTELRRRLVHGLIAWAG